MNKNIFCIIVTSFLLLLCGCNETIGVDISYARTPNGYINSGLKPLGMLLLWDMEANTITDIAEVDLSKSKYGLVQTGKLLKASNFEGFGIDITADMNKAKLTKVKAEIANEIKANSAILLENYRTRVQTHSLNPEA